MSKLPRKMVAAVQIETDHNAGSTGDENSPDLDSLPAKKRKKTGMLFSTGRNRVLSQSTRTDSFLPENLTHRSQLDQGKVDTSKDPPLSATFSSVSDEVATQYPYRLAQSRMLSRTLLATVRLTDQKARSTHRDFADDTYVPPPLFITGASGTGKTSIVRHVIWAIQERHCGSTFHAQNDNGAEQHSEVAIAEAYINCATIEPPRIGAVLESIYRQLGQGIGQNNDTQTHRVMPKKKCRTVEVTTKPAYVGTDMKGTGFLPNSVTMGNCDDEIVTPCAMESVFNSDGPPNQRFDRLHEMDSVHSLSENDSQEESDDENNEDVIEIQRRQFCHSEGKTNMFDCTNSKTYDKLLPQRRHPRQGDISVSEETEQFHLRSLESKDRHVKKEKRTRATISGLKSPVALGRALAEICTSSSQLHRRLPCFFLVLDHADRLFTLRSERHNSDRNNLLSQLLLLPKVMGLNLTVIVITNHMLLEYSRINNIQSSAHLLGTITDTIDPIRIHFHAYRGRDVFKNVLLVPRMRNLIIPAIEADDGKETCAAASTVKKAIVDVLYRSMLDTLIEALESTTRDLREIARLARIFWPHYIAPLATMPHKDLNFSLCTRLLEHTGMVGGLVRCSKQDCICHCMSDSSTALEDNSSKRNVIGTLNYQARHHVRKLLSHCVLNSGVGFEPTPSNSHLTAVPANGQIFTVAERLPVLTTFLLLAAFLCQNNKRDYDMNLYTNWATGKSKRGLRGSGVGKPGDAENKAFASSVQAQQKLHSNRQSTFPLERMLSIFTAIVSKSDGTKSLLSKKYCGNDGIIDTGHMGTVDLFNSLAQLRQFGLLIDVGNFSSSEKQSKLEGMKYVCTMSKELAQALADHVGFPLGRYLMHD